MPFSAARPSTEGRPAASVPVVITACAPVRPASSRARPLARPRWPESRLTAKRARWSSTATAGSAALPRKNGAQARTAMPAAPMNT